MKTLKVYEILDIKSAVDTLMENNDKFPIGIGFKICQFERHLTEIEEYVFERLFKVIDEKKIEFGEMNEEEMVIYQNVMETEMAIETFELTKNDLKTSNLEMNINEIKALSKLFDEK